MAERRSYESYFRDALEFDFLLQQYPYERETLQEILDLLVDTVCTKREYIRIASDDRPRDVVKSRFMKLNSSHIQYVLDCLIEDRAKIHFMFVLILIIPFEFGDICQPFFVRLISYEFPVQDVLSNELRIGCLTGTSVIRVFDRGLEGFIGIKEKDKADKVLESCECAMTVHHGGYSTLSEAYGAVVSWIAANGYEITGAPFDLYIKTQFDSLSPEEWETEVYFPVRKK